jgi:hypothetical protein
MFRAESETSRRYSNPVVSKAKKISSQKDQLLVIMSEYMSRTSSKEDIIKSLDVLKKQINSPS